MAKEWYLLNKPYGKYDDSDTVMEDAYSSNMGTDVEICNYDLSNRKKARVIVMSRTQDTQLKTRVHSILCKIGTCKTGEYVYYDGKYWLITGFVDNNGLYEKAVIEICEWLLTWQNSDGNIIQRWASADNATQYNNGETSADKLMYRSDQLKLRLPDDFNTLMMNHNQRFIIDKRTKYYEDRFAGRLDDRTDLPVITYKMTRIDSVSSNYGDSGLIGIMVTQDAQMKNDGYYVIDGVGYWLAFSADDSLDVNSENVEFDSAVIYIGMGFNTFDAPWLEDSSGTVKEHEWKIQSDILPYLKVKESDTSISIACDDSSMAQKEFSLSLIYDNGKEAQIFINIKEFI